MILVIYCFTYYNVQTVEPLTNYWYCFIKGVPSFQDIDVIVWTPESFFINLKLMVIFCLKHFHAGLVC